ncbi:MAG: PKD domain-containing protein [Bacteroidia bacterium]|nr:PKD domain-containing protein [Bacteroidia bacterium]
MKKTITYLSLVLSFLFVLNSGKIAAQCVANFNYTTNANGNVTFLANCTPVNSITTQYQWNFGNSATYSAIGSPTASITYTANGTYTVNLFYNTPPTCSNSVSYTINITNAITPTCNINANFSYTQGSNGAVSFTSTSTGTVPGTTYSWAYGDATAGSGATSSHTYAANGNYNVVLYANNNFTATCSDSVVIPIFVNSYPCALNASFTYTLGANGLVNFSSTSVGTNTLTSYSWNYGNSTSGSGPNPSTVYTNGTYTVTLMAMNSFTTCVSTATQVITVTSSTCNLNANFTFTQTGNGGVNFVSTSTGTVPGTTYTWVYGDASSNGTGASTSHTYAANGGYNVFLYATNNFTPSCSDSVSFFVNVTSLPCGLNPNFTFTQGSNGTVNFNSTSTGTVAGSVYSWQFGDFTSGSGNPTSHTYGLNGTYIATLTVINNSITCFSSVTKTIVVNSISVTPCNLVANYSHTVGAGGNVNFANTSTGTNANTTYYWNFGDGFTSTSQSPTHTYNSAGAYSVLLFVNNQTTPTCIDTIVQSINVTGIPCVANSNFSLAPSTTTLVWNATPASPWNVVAATWSWGDNSTSNTLYASHTYSASGTYSICLSVTVACGGSSSTCVNQFIFKSSSPEMQMIQVNVIPPALTPTAIKDVEIENVNYAIYPNPNSGQFDVKIDDANNETVKIKVYNLIGEVVYETETVNDNMTKKINLDNVANGVYFVKINSGSKESTKKMIINK